MKIKDLIAMFTYACPSAGKHGYEKSHIAFIEKFIEPVFGDCDEFGNFELVVGDNPFPEIMFTAHHDDVSMEGGRRRPVFDPATGILSADRKKKDILGADCKTGIWLILHMIENQIPGRYLIFADEEIGRHGSIDWADQMCNLEKIDKTMFCISFDRYGTTSIITHQSAQRCASQEFTDSLSDILDIGHKGDSGGSYTDSYTFISLIPECTNLSVGYRNQHSHQETQDTFYLEKLAAALVAADWSRLVAARDCTIKEFDAWDDDDRWGGYLRPKPQPTSGLRGFYQLKGIIERSPQVVVEFLEECALTQDFENYYDQYFGFAPPKPKEKTG